jgi:hypothetical protein
MTADPLVTLRHMRAANFCVRGARAWANRHKLDFDHFIRHGYPASVFEATNDALGKMLASIARKEAQEGAPDGQQE